MPFEYATDGGVLRLLRAECQWTIEFNGRRRGPCTSPGDAVTAAAHHATGLREWDRTLFAVPDDLLNWRPFGDNL
jgi:hypothetical protein